MISSGSDVRSTSATLGAVRPQPVRRCISVVADIVTRVPCDPSGLMEAGKSKPRWTMKLITVAVPCATTKAASRP